MKLYMSVFTKENLSSLGICRFSCTPADDEGLMVFLILASRFFAFPKLPEIWETYPHKKFNSQHNRKIKISRIMIFCSDCEIRMSRKLVFRLKREMVTNRSRKLQIAFVILLRLAFHQSCKCRVGLKTGP